MPVIKYPVGIQSFSEIKFQNMMAIACKMLGFAVRTEVHPAKGRCDMQIQTSSFVYIFEFKIDASPEEALEQIYEKGYDAPFEADPAPSSSSE